MKTNLKIELLKHRLLDEIEKAQEEQDFSGHYSDANYRREKWRARKAAFMECMCLIDEILGD